MRALLLKKESKLTGVIILYTGGELLEWETLHDDSHLYPYEYNIAHPQVNLLPKAL
jgi:hypothetical protein